MPNPTPANRHTDYVLLLVGLVLVILPLGFVVAFPDAVGSANTNLRLVAALGGGLVGSAIPGVLGFAFPVLGGRAVGGVAVLVLFWLTNPPGALNDTIVRPKCLSSAEVLRGNTPELAPRNALPCFDYGGETTNDKSNNDAYFRVNIKTPGTLKASLSGMSQTFKLQVAADDKSEPKTSSPPVSATTQTVALPVKVPGDYLVRAQPIGGPSGFRLNVSFEAQH